MALNDTFNILPKKTTKSRNELTSNSPIKDYWAEKCRENPSKKECLFYCD